MSVVFFLNICYNKLNIITRYNITKMRSSI